MKEKTARAAKANGNPVKTKYRFFTFSPDEFREMERYLADMARRGWILDRLGAFYMRFRQDIPGEYRFSVDLYTDIDGVDRPKSERIESYRQCCEDSGWSFADGYRETQVFYRSLKYGTAQEDAEPAIDEVLPVQTDDGIRNRLMLKYCRREFLISLLLLLLCLFYSAKVSMNYILLLRNSYILLAGTFLGCSLYVVVRCVYLGVKLLFLAITGDRKWSRCRKDRNISFLIFKKKLKLLMTSAFVTYAACLMLTVGAEQKEPMSFAVALMPLILGYAVGFTVRYFVNRSRSPKAARRAGLAAAFPVILLLYFITVKIFYGISDETELPTQRQDSRPVLTAGVLGEEEWFEEEYSSSAAVKDYYKYREISDQYDRAVTIYINAANDTLANLIYKNMIAQGGKDPLSGFLKQIEEDISLLTGKLYRDRIAYAKPLDMEVWGCEEGFMVGGRTLYLRKGTKILYFSVWQGTDLMKEQALQIVKQWFTEPPS